MQLTDNEKRDILKYLETNKPLPDKYRFLLFEEKREVELVWNGKTNEITNVVLPFQIIEQIDEPRAEGDIKLQGSLFDTSGRQISGWANKLIWGDNKLILSSLKNGPLREEIEREGGIKLIYIDPPFDVGADFSMNIEIGDEEFTKKPSVLEELAYRDTWGRGADSFIAMIYERLSLMKDLLANDGSIYVHCDWRMSPSLRFILDEIFGKENFQNEIYWYYYNKLHGASKDVFPRATDTILYYVKSKKEDFIFNHQKEPRDKPVKKLKYHFIGGKIVNDKDEFGKTITYLSTERQIDNVWRIRCLQPADKTEWLGYDTQKPQDLVERIIKTSSNEGDLVADFFSGSGTALAAAESLGRRWIGSDLGKFAIHTTRKRMIGIQRQLKQEGKNYRAFEILNLGKYERQHYIGVNPNLRDEEKQKQVAEKEKNFLNLILSAYKAETVSGFKTFHGKKASRLIAVGPINLPVSRLFADEVIDECVEKHITKVDILAFEFEMGLFPNIQEEAKDKGVDLALKYIPRDVFDKRAIEKNQVVFHDVSYLEVKPHIKGSSAAIELIDFSVFYNQDSIQEVEENLKNGGKKLIVESGQIIKVAKDKNGVVTREILTKKWTDWIDYWSVDFDYESKKEIVRIRKEKSVQAKIDGSIEPEQTSLGEFEEVWTGDYVFENEWQSFRTKKNRSLELITSFKELPKGRHKIAIKVVDIFGNDTMKVIQINL